MLDIFCLHALTIYDGFLSKYLPHGAKKLGTTSVSGGRSNAILAVSVVDWYSCKLFIFKKMADVFLRDAQNVSKLHKKDLSDIDVWFVCS